MRMSLREIKQNWKTNGKILQNLLCQRMVFWWIRIKIGYSPLHFTILRTVVWTYIP